MFWELAAFAHNPTPFWFRPRAASTRFLLRFAAVPPLTSKSCLPLGAGIECCKSILRPVGITVDVHVRSVRQLGAATGGHLTPFWDLTMTVCECVRVLPYEFGSAIGLSRGTKSSARKVLTRNGVYRKAAGGHCGACVRSAGFVIAASPPLRGGVERHG